ncbi:MAG: ABC transporter substrate-binding protein [bacterium]
MNKKLFKRIGMIALIILIILLLIKACVNADIEEKSFNNTEKENALSVTKQRSPGNFKTVEINGVEYKQARGEVGQFGGTLVSSSIGEGPKTFNPWVSKDATSGEMSDLMFDGLVNTDAYTGEVNPQLAKEIKVDKSGKVYTIKLRKGLTWSDGKSITADDVLFTYNTIIAKGFGNASMRDNILVNNQMPSLKKIDDLTVEFTTPSTFAPFLRQLSIPIAPKHILEAVTNQGEKEFNLFWGVSTNPKDFVTSGMFRLSKYIPAQRVEFVRNTNYYFIDKKGRQLPYLSKYIIQIVGDINNQVLKFEGKELDFLGINGSMVSKFKAFEKHSDYKIYNLGPDLGTTFFTLNLNKRKNDAGEYYVNPIKQKWFNDLNFRTAVDYTIDRESIVSNVLSGVGAPLFTAEALSSIYLNQKIKNGHPRDINYAKNLLRKSGFTWDKNGLLHDKDGNQVEFNLLTNAGNTEREAVGVMVKEDLEELGIKVNFKPIEFNVLVGKLNDTLDWEGIIIGLTGSPLEPHNGKNVWYSTGSLHLFNQRKGKELETKADLRPWEAQLDTMFDKGASALAFNERKKYYDQYQDIVYKEKPMIYLYSPLRISAIRKKYKNIRPTIIGGMLHNLEEIYIKEK